MRTLATTLLSLSLLTFAACGGEEGADLDDDAAMEAPAEGTMTTTGATLRVSQQGPYGAFLTDAQGRSVYLFQADEAGAGTSQCYDACAEAWPPVLTTGAPQAGQGADASLLGTLQRQDGQQQVTYDGWPLYYFVRDQGAGQTQGQDVMGFGAEWYLVSPDGEAVHAEGAAEASS